MNFTREALFQIYSESGKKFRIRPDPDPQHCCTGLHLAGDEQTRVSSDTTSHRLNTGTELDLQSILGIHVHSCTRWLSSRNSPHPLPLHLGSQTRVLLVSQDRRHLFVTPRHNRNNERMGDQIACISVGNNFRVRPETGSLLF